MNSVIEIFGEIRQNEVCTSWLGKEQKIDYGEG